MKLLIESIKKKMKIQLSFSDVCALSHLTKKKVQFSTHTNANANANEKHDWP